MIKVLKIVLLIAGLGYLTIHATARVSYRQGYIAGYDKAAASCAYDNK